MGTGEDSCPEPAGTVLQKLLAPPSVPDAAWFAAASTALLRAAAIAPSLVLSQPEQHRECALIVRCLREGSFRTQSAVLELLANAIGHSLTVDHGESGVGRACPMIPQALHLLVMDPGIPVLSAALALCREQPPSLRNGQAEGKEQQCIIVRGTAGLNSAGLGIEGDQASAFVQQKCCEDPTDCEEPTVRERALRFLACLAQHATAPRSCASSMPNLNAQQMLGLEERRDGTQGGVPEPISMHAGLCCEEETAHVKQKLWHICTVQDLLKDVLAAFSVSSEMVTTAAGEALSKVVLLDLPADSWHQVSKLVTKHLGSMGPLLADLALEAACQTHTSLLTEMMQRVSTLRKEELPRECCLKGNAVRVALTKLLRSLVTTHEGIRAARRLRLFVSLLVFLRSENTQLRSAVCELVCHAARHPRCGELLLPGDADLRGAATASQGEDDIKTCGKVNTEGSSASGEHRPLLGGQGYLQWNFQGNTLVVPLAALFRAAGGEESSGEERLRQEGRQAAAREHEGQAGYGCLMGKRVAEAAMCRDGDGSMGRDESMVRDDSGEHGEVDRGQEASDRRAHAAVLAGRTDTGGMRLGGCRRQAVRLEVEVIIKSLLSEGEEAHLVQMGLMMLRNCCSCCTCNIDSCACNVCEPSTAGGAHTSALTPYGSNAESSRGEQQMAPMSRGAQLECLAQALRVSNVTLDDLMQPKPPAQTHTEARADGGLGPGHFQVQRVVVLMHALNALRAVIKHRAQAVRQCTSRVPAGHTREAGGLSNEFPTVEGGVGYSSTVGMAGEWLGVVQRVMGSTSPSVSVSGSRVQAPAGGVWTCMDGLGMGMGMGVDVGGAGQGAWLSSHKVAALRRCALMACRDLFVWCNEIAPAAHSVAGQCAHILTAEAMHGQNTLSTIAAIDGIRACVEHLAETKCPGCNAGARAGNAAGGVGHGSGDARGGIVEDGRRGMPWWQWQWQVLCAACRSATSASASAFTEAHEQPAKRQRSARASGQGMDEAEGGVEARMLSSCGELVQVVSTRCVDLRWEVRHAAVLLGSSLLRSDAASVSCAVEGQVEWMREGRGVVRASGPRVAGVADVKVGWVAEEHGVVSDAVEHRASLCQEMYAALDDCDPYVRSAAWQAVAAGQPLMCEDGTSDRCWGRKLVTALHDSEAMVRRTAVSVVQSLLAPSPSARVHDRGAVQTDEAFCVARGEGRSIANAAKNEALSFSRGEGLCAKRVPAMLCVPELLGETLTASACSGEASLRTEQAGHQWRSTIASCLNDVDWEVGLRTMELLRRLGGIPGRQLVDEMGRWTIDNHEEFCRAQGVTAKGHEGQTAQGIERMGLLVSEWHALFWECDGGVLLETALENADKPIRISAAALLMRMMGAGAVRERETDPVEDDVALVGVDYQVLREKKRDFLGRLPGLVERARAMLDATSQVQRSQDLGGQGTLGCVDQGQLECAD